MKLESDGSSEEANQNSVFRECYSGISRYVKTLKIGEAAIDMIIQYESAN